MEDVAERRFVRAAVGTTAVVLSDELDRNLDDLFATADGERVAGASLPDLDLKHVVERRAALLAVSNEVAVQVGIRARSRRVDVTIRDISRILTRSER